MKRMLLILLALAAGAGAANAAEQPRVQAAVGNSPVTLTPSASPAPGCAVGNLPSPTCNYGNWITGNGSCATLIQPQTEGCGCEAGFGFDRVYMLMQFGFEMTSTSTWRVSARVPHPKTRIS